MMFLQHLIVTLSCSAAALTPNACARRPVYVLIASDHLAGAVFGDNQHLPRDLPGRAGVAFAVRPRSYRLVVVPAHVAHASSVSVAAALAVRLAGRKEMFYLTTHSTHFIYGYMASDIWLRTILIVRKETRCRHIGYSLRLTGRVILYASYHRQDSTYHGLCYTSCGALAGTRNSSMGLPHEGSIRQPIAP